MKEKTIEEILEIRINNCYYCKNADIRRSKKKGPVLVYCYENEGFLINEELLGKCVFFEEDDE